MLTIFHHIHMCRALYTEHQRVSCELSRLALHAQSPGPRGFRFDARSWRSRCEPQRTVHRRQRTKAITPCGMSTSCPLCADNPRRFIQKKNGAKQVLSPPRTRTRQHPCAPPRINPIRRRGTGSAGSGPAFRGPWPVLAPCAISPPAPSSPARCRAPVGRWWRPPPPRRSWRSRTPPWPGPRTRVWPRCLRSGVGGGIWLKTKQRKCNRKPRF